MQAPVMVLSEAQAAPISGEGVARAALTCQLACLAPAPSPDAACRHQHKARVWPQSAARKHHCWQGERLPLGGAL